MLDYSTTPHNATCNKETPVRVAHDQQEMHIPTRLDDTVRARGHCTAPHPATDITETPTSEIRNLNIPLASALACAGTARCAQHGTFEVGVVDSLQTHQTQPPEAPTTLGLRFKPRGHGSPSILNPKPEIPKPTSKTFSFWSPWNDYAQHLQTGRNVLVASSEAFRVSTRTLAQGVLGFRVYGLKVLSGTYCNDPD